MIPKKNCQDCVLENNKIDHKSYGVCFIHNLHKREHNSACRRPIQSGGCLKGRKTRKFNR